MVELSSGPPQSGPRIRHRSRFTGRVTAGGAPVLGYVRSPGEPAIAVIPFDGPLRPLDGRPHAHDFLVVTYLVAGGGTIRVNQHDLPAGPGDVVVLAPGDVITGGEAGLEATAGWCVCFPPDVLAASTWAAHPLLFPYTIGTGGTRRLHVPTTDQPGWVSRIRALDGELRDRRTGYADAALAHLTLLLVALSRLADDVPGDLRRNGEPLLAAVFDTIEARYAEPLSLRDVAAAVGLTPGHLTTTVARKTGRTVQQWITERRMAEARRLLAGTDLTVAALAARTGYRDPGYFIRTFRREHGRSPAAWRHASFETRPPGTTRS